MISAVDAFLVEIRSHPKFIAALDKDQIWAEHVDAIELVLRSLYMQGDDNPQAIELFDAVCGIVRCKNLTLKKRLVMLSELLGENQTLLEGWIQKP
jgi:hypothetical protein